MKLDMRVADLILDMIMAIRESDIMLPPILSHRVSNKIVLCITIMIGSIQALQGFNFRGIIYIMVFLAKMQEINFSLMRLPLLIYALQN